MAANELRGTVHHHVGSMLQRPYEQWGKGVVHNKEDAMAMCHLGNGIQVCHVTVGVAERLGVDDLGVGTYGRFQSLCVVHVHNAVFHALRAQCVGDEVE